MSVVPICCKMPYRDQTPQIQRSTRHSERGFTSLQARNDSEQHRRRSFSGLDLQRTTVRYSSSESPTNEKQIKSLASYFGKLQNVKTSDSSDSTSSSSSSSSSSYSYSKETITSDQHSAKKELKILDSYLDKLDKEDRSALVEPPLSSFNKIPIKDSTPAEEKSDAVDERNTSSYMNHRSKTNLNSPKSSQRLEQDDETTSDLYLISVLASINIAVILFEIASPVRGSEVELSTIPLLYGAKVNHLIMLGEWWRLVTPMFLHSGAFHIALSCWSLRTFGPKVCKGYGSFTFLLIYILGGISGNLISFLHTPDPTVGGTGPVYAIIGAWLIYQLQNKEVIEKDVSESMFQKAIIATGIGLILSHFCPIDEWSHFGAVFTGVAFGFLACPTPQLGDSASRAGGEEGIALAKRQSNPCKSLLLFGVFVLVLSCLFFLVDPPSNELLSESFFIKSIAI